MSAPALVAVVSYNTRELLDRALRSLRPDAEAGRADVWVVDNASTDGSADLVRGEHPWVSLVASEENLGFGRAVNLVARRAEPGWSFIAPANADIALEPDALRVLLRAAAADGGSAAYAPRLVRPDGRPEHSFFAFPSVPGTLAFNLSLHRVVPGLAERLCLEGHTDLDRERTVPWAVGAFLLVRRGAWERVGGFDEGQFMYAEDLDLGWRLRDAGAPTRYVPDARVHHEVAASTTSAWGEGGRLDRAQTASYAWMARRLGVRRTWAIGRINAAGAAVRWAGCAAAARGLPQRYADRRDWWYSWRVRHATTMRRAIAERPGTIGQA